MAKIQYRKGLLEKGVAPDNLPVKLWQRDEIPEEARNAIKKEGLLSLGGVYGDRHIGDLADYDHLRMTLEAKTAEITVFNRGITLMFSNDEKVRCIHRVLCKLDQPGGI